MLCVIATHGRESIYIYTSIQCLNMCNINYCMIPSHLGAHGPLNINVTGTWNVYLLYVNVE